MTTPLNADEVLQGRDLQQIFRLWDEQHQTQGFDPLPIVKRLAAILEEDTEAFAGKFLDPFDERHPSRADPDCELGKSLKLIFKKDNFLTRLINDYLRENFFTRQNINKSSLQLNISACRLILNIMPGLETTAVFQPDSDNLINRIYSWAEDGIEPLQSYATGLLAAAMEVSEIVAAFRELNLRLVPKMLKRIQMLQAVYKSRDRDTYKLLPSAIPSSSLTERDFNKSDVTNEIHNKIKVFSYLKIKAVNQSNAATATTAKSPETLAASTSSPLSISAPSDVIKLNGTVGDDNGDIQATSTINNDNEDPIKENHDNVCNAEDSGNIVNDDTVNVVLADIDGNANISAPPNNLSINTSSNLSMLIENENSRDASTPKNLIKSIIPIHPATIETCQMFILRYLTVMGEYQEFLGLIFEYNVVQLILSYIENVDPRDTCLAFEALKYLSSLLCHKKFALEFITHGGLELLLKIPRPASTAVSVTFYYLAYCEDAMERICSMSKKVISEFVSYGLSLLGSKHDSAKCHATMFFGLGFQFKVILDEFDNQDGLRKIYNVISVLRILSSEDIDDIIPDDEETASRQLVRHVCVTLKRYMESHLFFKFHYQMRQQQQYSVSKNNNLTPILKTNKCTLEQIGDQIRYLQENTPVRMHWAPVDQLLKLGGVTLLLRIVAYSYDWYNSSGRAEIVRSALDVLSVCCVTPKVYSAFCDPLNLPDGNSSAGINAILGAAIGELFADADVQKSALAVLIHIVCAPLSRPLSINRFGSLVKKKVANRHAEELVEKVWENVCSNNGIIVLLQLMQTKTPITDADCIRGMACQALAGLARSERVKQIISKLPLFANGQIQHLMRDPILQEKRVEHVAFQKYALELLERVSGKTMNQLHTSLTNIHKANVVAQTRISYNEQQLYQLIHDHFISKGMHETAAILQKEAGLNATQTHSKPLFSHSIFNLNKDIHQSSMIVPRSRIRTKTQDFNSSFQNILNESSTSTLPALPGPSTSTSSSSVNAATNLNEFEFPPLPIEDQLSYSTPIKIRKFNSANTNQQQQQQQQQQQHQQPTKSLQKPFDDSSTSNYYHLQSHQQNFPSLSTASTSSSILPSSTNNITLSTIVTEYLTNQHALCNNPMTTCPQFDLLVPHKCPDPKPNRVFNSTFDYNLTARLFKAQAGYNTMRLDRRYVHQQFSPIKIIRPQDPSEYQFSCCDFLSNGTTIIAGTHSGEAKLYNINDSVEEYTTQCHNGFMESIKCNRTGNLVLTTTTWRSPLSILWSLDNNNRELISKLRFDQDSYMEFSNLRQDKILGTKLETARIYDLNTGQKICAFEPKMCNHYVKNRATFCPTDELILSDGVLWDVRSGQEIHKFDKLNQTLSGVFHPNNLEIISNTEIWDLRTFHLLQTVSALDQCLIKFSPLNTIYGVGLNNSEDNDDFDSTNHSYNTTSFKVLDSYDYSSISTIDVKRSIYDLNINKAGSYIILCETQHHFEAAVQESLIKIYAVGVRKTDEDEDEEEELQSEENSESDDSSNNSAMFFERIGAGRQNRRRRNRNRDNAGGGDNGAGNDDAGGRENNPNRRRRRRRRLHPSANNDNENAADDDSNNDDNNEDDDDDDDNNSWASISFSETSDYSNDNSDDNNEMLVEFVL